MKKPIPLTAVLKTEKLELVEEREIPLEHFPDMIELAKIGSDAEPVPSVIELRQFFKTGITDRRGFYREGTSYRISQ